MAEFVQKHAWKKEHREQADSQTWVARGDEEDGLNFTVQKPLEKNQRRECEEEPEEAGEHGLAISLPPFNYGSRYAASRLLDPPLRAMMLIYSSLCDGEKLIQF